jgi:predicted nucleic acid-binding protein
MLFVDSNVPMYLVGGEHPNRDAARHAVELAIAGRERLVTDAEVLQEILHRYVAIERREATVAASSTLLAIVDEVYPIELEDVERARHIVTTSRLSARDAVHLAVMQRRGIGRILTFDRGFDGIPGLTRLHGET